MLNTKELTFLNSCKDILHTVTPDWKEFFIRMENDKTLWPTNALRIFNFLFSNGYSNILEIRDNYILEKFKEILNKFRNMSTISGSTVRKVNFPDFIHWGFNNVCGMPTSTQIDLINEHSVELGARVKNNSIIIDL